MSLSHKSRFLIVILKKGSWDFFHLLYFSICQVFFIDNYGSLPPSLSVLAALSVMHGNFIYKMQYPFAERTTMLPGGLNVISVFCVYTTL